MRFIHVALLVFLFIHIYPVTASSEDDFFKPESRVNVQEEGNEYGCQNCSACSSSEGDFIMPFGEFPFVLLAVFIFVLLVVKKNKWRVLFWTVGISVIAGLLISIANKKTLTQSSNIPQNEFSSVVSAEKELQKTDTLKDEFADFEPIDSTDEFDAFDNTSADEFQPLSDSEEIYWAGLTKTEWKSLSRTLIALLLTVFAGIIFRYSLAASKIRYVFLLTSMIYFGFYSSACPCMISSFQNLILFLLGESVHWILLVWIVGLLLITYLFGKVWCGWVCHLGALQEFLYRPEFKIFRSVKMQRSFKIIRWCSLAALVVQLIITRTNLYIKIDPFKVAYNLFSTNVTGYVLLGILLISSLLIYRPFCRAFCPVGLVLGWIEKIPGARVLQVQKTCKSCNQCVKKCNYQAISNENGNVLIDNAECISCGECVSTCRFDAIEKDFIVTESKRAKNEN